jgi:hypothetical protein
MLNICVLVCEQHDNAFRPSSMMADEQLPSLLILLSYFNIHGWSRARTTVAVHKMVFVLIGAPITPSMHTHNENEHLLLPLSSVAAKLSTRYQ